MARTDPYAGLHRRWRSDSPPGRRANGVVGCARPLGRALGPRGGLDQWLRPPHPLGRRPLGGHDRRFCKDEKPSGHQPSKADGGGHGRHRRDRRGGGRPGAVFGGPHPARPRHHAARLGVGHRRFARAHRRGTALSDQHQRRFDQRRHLCDCRRDRAHGAACARALPSRPGVLHDGRRRLEDGAQHVGPL